MPLFDYLCMDCGKYDEILVIGNGQTSECRFCGSGNMKKLLSAHSSISGIARPRLPGANDTGCCGSSPEHSGCDGPGSCCGRAQG
jgi:putative FmdB family regulatory protein